MKWWALAKQFPKYVLVAGIIVGSTALFAFWWLFLRSHPTSPAQTWDDAAARAAIAKNAAKAEARIDYLFLADDDLYDAETGECLFKNWLHGDHPNRLYYDAKTKKIIGQYEQGFARYAFDGTREAAMMMQLNPPALVPGSKKIVFAKGKDIWTAEIDWDAFKFVNERQVTTMGVFYDQNFAANVQLLTEKTLVVRNGTNLLHVDLETGNVKPMRLPLGEIGKRRSPDSKWVAGVQNGQFYCYDVDANEAKTIQVSRAHFSDFQWLGNDRCLALSDKTVTAYDRVASTLTEVVTLPFSCFKMAEPSPDGRYIFCAGGMNARNDVLVDLERRTASAISGGSGVCWLNNDSFTYACDAPDSDARGTWLQLVAKNERRVSSEPYLTSGTQARELNLSAVNIIIFETRKGLSKSVSNNFQCEEIKNIPKGVQHLSRVWKIQSE